MLPDQIKKFIDAFSRLPSIGPRLATRLAFYLSSTDKNELNEIESAIAGLKNLNRCPRCFFVKGSGKFCSICLDPKRDKYLIAVVEKDTDLMSIEKTGVWAGQYLVLGELVEHGAPDPSMKLKLQNLLSRIKNELSGSAEEIVIALAPTTFGDFTAQIVTENLKGFSKKITRLGRGIPTGGEIEFADEETLGHALKSRS